MFSSNRTFMELKSYKKRKQIKAHGGSNRTFMELKSYKKRKQIKAHGVLIAPLWN